MCLRMAMVRSGEQQIAPLRFASVGATKYLRWVVSVELCGEKRDESYPCFAQDGPPTFVVAQV
jgi:hypothetical protein